MNKIFKNNQFWSLTLSITVFTTVMVMFLSLVIPKILLGPSSADDAWIALAAKNLAYGKGYATSVSDTTLIPYDPFISTGPPLVIPTSIAIKFFGNTGWVPGAVQIFVYILQLCIVTFLLAKRFGLARSLFFSATLNFVVVFATLKFGLFGSLLGEPVAFGFILIGLVLFAAYTGFLSAVVATLCFSFAFMTKQISLFPIIGILIGFFLINIYEGQGFRNVVNKFIVIGLIFLSLPIAFEVMKLLALGFKGFIQTIQSTANFAIAHESEALKFNERLNEFIKVFSEYYINSAIVTVITLLLMLSLTLLLKKYKSASDKRDCLIFKNIFILSICGAFVLFFYVIFICPRIWPRYLWIGIAVALIGITAFLLITSFKQRVIFSGLILSLLFIFDGYEMISMRHNYLNKLEIAADRNKVINLLDNSPDIPYAAEYWSSIYDVVYMRTNEGRWRFGQDIKDLHGSHFFAVINNQFTDKNSNFYISVNKLCKPLVNLQHFGLFDCNQSFWLGYNQ